MDHEYRPNVLGALPEVGGLPPQEAIERVEKDLMAAAECLRGIRSDYVDGAVSEDRLAEVEDEFVSRLIRQRQILQNLRRAAEQSRP